MTKSYTMFWPSFTWRISTKCRLKKLIAIRCGALIWEVLGHKWVWKWTTTLHPIVHQHVPHVLKFSFCWWFTVLLMYAKIWDTPKWSHIFQWPICKPACSAPKRVRGPDIKGGWETMFGLQDLWFSGWLDMIIIKHRSYNLYLTRS